MAPRLDENRTTSAPNPGLMSDGDGPSGWLGSLQQEYSNDIGSMMSSRSLFEMVVSKLTTSGGAHAHTKLANFPKLTLSLSVDGMLVFSDLRACPLSFHSPVNSRLVSAARLARTMAVAPGTSHVFLSLIGVQVASRSLPFKV